jgi:hypothetical protein
MIADSLNDLIELRFYIVCCTKDMVSDIAELNIIPRNHKRQVITVGGECETGAWDRQVTQLSKGLPNVEERFILGTNTGNTISP